MKYLFLLSGIFFCLLSCNSKNEGDNRQNVGKNIVENPPAPGFDAEGSDPQAIEIADMVMKAMGGRGHWDKERFFTWNFFGARTLWWDKKTGDVRIAMHRDDSTTIFLNIYDDAQGRLYMEGKEVVQPDSLQKYLQQGKGIWINDAYWLFMPFKLKDSGVTLSYVGEDTSQTGIMSDVLQLTFKDVGNTPDNKYRIWVDQSDHLIKQWAYYRENSMEEPNFITPWGDYRRYGEILLGGDRGERDITDIGVIVPEDSAIFSVY